ncbi:MAG: PTS sugar transporter subunit IIA [bacterium]|nr:PTS sugar transporter subunit IIA [Candidatus Kapabacteria bacterium]
MQIASLLEEAFVAVNMPATTKDEALMKLVDMLGASPNVLDLDKVRAAIVEREKIMSTGVGHGFAIPHAKVDALTDIVAAFATLQNPVDFQALDGQPVRIVFMLVGRETHVGTHLKLLSRVSRLMNNETFREQLLLAASPADVVQLFQEEENRYFETRTTS